MELKLELDPSHAARLRRHLGGRLEGAKPAQKKLVSVYFDTPDLRLRRNGVSLRVRRADGKHIQTIKDGNGSAAGLFDRAEWEQNISGPLPDLEAAKDTALEPLLSGEAATLRPAFETRIERSQYRLTSRGSDIEIALDQGEVDTGDRRSPLCELELELKDGDAAELFQVARTIGKGIPLRLSLKSKADRGYELVDNSVGGPEKAAGVHLSATTTAAEGFEIVARECLKQVLANEATTVRGDGEALHQMRIGLRRLRAAISTFGSVVKDRPGERIKSELRWISRKLSPARDLDVLVAEVLAPLRRHHPNDAGVAAVCRDFDRRRSRAHKAAVTAICSPRFRGLVFDVAEWIQVGPWRRSDDALQQSRRDQSVAALAADELRRRRRKIRKKAKSLRELSTPGRHKLRIRAKKLRYAIEFFTDVFPAKKQAKRSKAALASLKELQDALGALNDVATREKIASRVALSRRRKPRRGEGREKAFAAGVIVGSQEARVQHTLKDGESASARFAAVKRFWT